MSLNINTKAPDFSSIDESGEKIKLGDYKGKWVVLYFYPKDDTPGCTKEACAFRDNMERITSLGAVVIGVSPDNSSSHDKFKSKYNLNFSLVVDTDKEICNSYDVIGEKNMYGKIVVGLIRTTYIINDKGNIAHVFPNVKVDGHVDAVISKLIELQA